MSPPSSTAAIRDQAVAWFVRLQGGDVAEDDWIAFRAWLEAGPANRVAYDEVEGLWVDLDDAADSTVVPFQPRSVAPPPLHRRTFLRWGAPIAACLAVGIGVRQLRPQAPDPPPADVYETAPGEIRAIPLADGSRIDLDAASRVEVRLAPGTRAVALVRGEAAFDVAHDPARPFLVAVGDRTVRVVGTEFNVLRQSGQVRVTVRRGVVAVAGDGGAEHRLTPGQQFEHREGSSQSAVTQVSADDAFAWKRGALVYRDRPLAEVAADLSRHSRLPVRVEPAAQRLRFTGTLSVDTLDAMLARLETFMPISVERSATEIRLRARAH
ncbi:FecR family protein [Phenylobacterium sp.]|uniref:FecR family protein n=1 Tax=Phenylobacterium sp. TaxID=1871053 RepID=UPI002F3E4E76